MAEVVDLSQLDDSGLIPQSLRLIWKEKFTDPLIAVHKSRFADARRVQMYVGVFCFLALVGLFFLVCNFPWKSTTSVTLMVTPIIVGALMFLGVVLSAISASLLEPSEAEKKAAKDFAVMLGCLYETLEITPERLANLTGEDIEELVFWTLLRYAKQIKALEATGDLDGARRLEKQSFAPLHQVAFDLVFWLEEGWNALFRIAQEESEEFKECQQRVQVRMPDLYPEPRIGGDTVLSLEDITQLD